MTEKELWTPVAEYRGVAIWEKAGNRRAVWHGCEYFTDGLSYVFWWDGDGMVAHLGLPDERAARELIDAIRDNPSRLNAENELPLADQEYLDWTEAWQGVTKKP